MENEKKNPSDALLPQKKKNGASTGQETCIIFFPLLLTMH